jgi:hypothetical protein
LKVGFLATTKEKTDGGPISTYEDGFVLSGADLKGECY